MNFFTSGVKKEEIKLIEAVKLIRVQPGDIIILKTKRQLPIEAIDRMLKTFTEHILEPMGFKNKVKVAILEEDMDIEIMRKEEIK